MPACATPETIADQLTICNLFLPVPDTDFRDYLAEGNAADSAMLVKSITAAFTRTGVIANSVSTDDGYASAKGRDKLLELGVKTISISGAKGKKLTASEDWNSEEYKDARRCRSAVESLTSRQ